MGGACYFLSAQITLFLGDQALFARIMNVMISVGVGVLVFGMTAKILRVGELEQLSAALLRRLSKRKGVEPT
jgi:hypothetical protein